MPDLQRNRKKLNFTGSDELLEIAEPFHMRNATIAANAVIWELLEIRTIGRRAFHAM